MSKLVAMLALVAFVGSVALAADTAAPETPKDVTVKGSVVKVEEKIVTVSVVSTKATRDRKITTDDKTVVTVDGKDSKVADIKAGMTVEVTLPAGRNTVATKIVAVKAATTAPAAGAPSTTR